LKTIPELSDREPLTRMSVAQRASSLLRYISTHEELDAIVISSLVNIRYLTGFAGSAAVLLVMGEANDPRLVLATDGRYENQAPNQLQEAGVTAELVIGHPGRQWSELARHSGEFERIGFESEHMSWALHRRVTSIDVFGDRLVPTKGAVETLRRVKDPGEIQRIQRAARIADEALSESLEGLPALVRSKNPVSEAGFAADLEFRMRMLGSTEPAFETIVACGNSAALPHHRASSSPIELNQPIVVDFGATCDGYRSDMTRTFVIGRPSAGIARMLEVVAESQESGVARVGAGVESSEVDKACREIIERAGWGDAFTHGTGHGVGLDIHEAPWIGSRSEDVLSAGEVVTVEPGVYIPSEGGVRIEDTVVVTESGCYAVTEYPKSPIL